jgi:hypothetical protein
MADVIYNSFKVKIADGNIDLNSDTIKVALVTSGYTPDQDAHDFFNDVTNEVSGTGYSAGGETLANATMTQDNTNNRGKFDADDVTWATSTITARGAVIYKSTGTASTSPLIAYIDFGSDKSSSASNFTIQWHADGILTLS